MILPDRSDLPAGYGLEAAAPSVADYLRLRQVSGLTRRSALSAAAGLPNSLFAFSIRHEADIVGMGRIVGDGALLLHIVDVAIDPRHQGRGLGKAIMAALLAWIERTVPAEAYVSLMANGEAHRLYARFGFTSVLPEACRDGAVGELITLNSNKPTPKGSLDDRSIMIH